MYYYIVDPQKLAQKVFERVQNQLYSSVSEFRVNGEVVRSTGVRTITQLVESAFAHSAKTIVAVGGDDTFQEVINAVGSREVVIGFIPIVESKIGELLGLKSVEQSVKTLAGRRTEELDMGSVNGNLFFSSLSFGSIPENNPGWLGSLNYKFIQTLKQIPAIDIKFKADDQFEASLPVVGGIIKNSSNPTDGKLDLILLPAQTSWNTFKYRSEIMNQEFEKIPGSSIFHIERLEIATPAGLSLKTEGRLISKTPATIEVRPKALKIIVGKDRKF